MIKQRLAARTQEAVAHELGISKQYLCDLLSRRRQPGGKVLQALKLKRVVIYRDDP
jgi:hypothetical protein